MSDVPSNELLPTWEQLLGGVGAGAPGRPTWRLAAVTPRHVGDGEDQWACLARELGLDSGMSWREAWAWTALAGAGAAVVSSAVALLH